MCSKMSWGLARLSSVRPFSGSCALRQTQPSHKTSGSDSGTLEPLGLNFTLSPEQQVPVSSRFINFTWCFVHKLLPVIL
jgi:hypothetical protein